MSSPKQAPDGAEGVTDRGSDGRWAAGNTVRVSTGLRSVRVRRKRRRQHQAEIEQQLLADALGPIPAHLMPLLVTAVADLQIFERHIDAHGGPIKTNGAMLACWPAYEQQRRLVLDLFERAGIVPARGRAARTAPARARAQKALEAAQAEAELKRRYGRPPGT